MIKSAISQVLYVDPVNGKDSNSRGATGSTFKTPQAAVTSTPDTCFIDLHIVNDANSYLVIDKPISIENRAILSRLALSLLLISRHLPGDLIVFERVVYC